VRESQNHKKRTAKQSFSSKIRQKMYNTRRVLRHAEALQVVAKDHAVHHDGHNTAETRLDQQYYIHELRAKVAAVGGRNCTTCATHEPLRKKPVQPILTRRKGQLVMFDLTKFYVPVEHHTLCDCMCTMV
jgi:hypothetical protein